MDNKFNNMLQEFLKNNNIESLEEANEKLQEFIMMYNNGEIEYENTPLDDAYEMLKEAEDRNKERKERIDIAKKVYKKYLEENLEMLFPLFALYYKLVDETKAKSYLNRINKANKYFIKFFKETIKENEDVMPGYYQKGESSEVLMYFETYSYLTDTMPLLDEFVLENSEKNSTKKKK